MCMTYCGYCRCAYINIYIFVQVSLACKIEKIEKTPKSSIWGKDLSSINIHIVFPKLPCDMQKMCHFYRAPEHKKKI